MCGVAHGAILADGVGMSRTRGRWAWRKGRAVLAYAAVWVCAVRWAAWADQGKDTALPAVLQPDTEWAQAVSESGAPLDESAPSLREMTETLVDAGDHGDLPFSIFGDGGTARASRLVSGALEDHKRAGVIGKASVQTVILATTRNHAVLRLTTAIDATYTGRPIRGLGWFPFRSPNGKRSTGAGPIGKISLSIRWKKDKALERVADRPLERAADIRQGVLAFRPDGARKRGPCL